VRDIFQPANRLAPAIKSARTVIVPPVPGVVKPVILPSKYSVSECITLTLSPIINAVCDGERFVTKLYGTVPVVVSRA
jgi:hypothetical protein